MSVTRKRQRMKRTQISLPEEELRDVREMAARRGMSMSRVFRSAIKKEQAEDQAARERLMGFVGIGEAADTKGSVNHDDTIYQ